MFKGLIYLYQYRVQLKYSSTLNGWRWRAKPSFIIIKNYNLSEEQNMVFQDDIFFHIKYILYKNKNTTYLLLNTEGVQGCRDPASGGGGRGATVFSKKSEP